MRKVRALSVGIAVGVSIVGSSPSAALGADHGKSDAPGSEREAAYSLLLNDPATQQKTADTSDSTQWKFRGEFTMWIWMVAMNGRLGVRDLVADVDASFGDILSGSDSLFAFSGRAEFGAGPIAGYVDASYSKLGVDDRSGPGGLVNADLTTEMAFIDFGVMFRVLETPSQFASEENRRQFSIDLYGGGRYTWLDAEIAPDGAPARTRSVDWFDPVIGVKFRIPFGDRWHAAINGDIGGFGVGSDFTWSSTALIGYDFHIGHCPSTVYFGYRALGQDYSRGSGVDAFLWDIIQHGPILGLSLSF